MKTQRSWWLGAFGIGALLVVLLLVVPAWAAPSGHGDEAGSDAYAAMHAACEAGDVQEMTDAMNSLTGEDWEAMGQHMNDGHHGVIPENRDEWSTTSLGGKA